MPINPKPTPTVNTICSLEAKIMEVLNQKNNWINVLSSPVTVHFDYDETIPNNCILRLVTHNRSHNTVFILHQVKMCILRERLELKIEALKLMLDYVKQDAKPRELLSYTVKWFNKNNIDTIIQSYFYGHTLLDVCEKFYFDKNKLDYVITNISLNPES